MFRKSSLSILTNFDYKNLYNNYIFNTELIYYNLMRIEKIYKSLTENITSSNINNILNNIENVISEYYLYNNSVRRTSKFFFYYSYFLHIHFETK